MKKYLLYHVRWQFSALVMMGPLYLINEYIGLNSYINLCLVQFVGALLFWYIDKWLFALQID